MTIKSEHRQPVERVRSKYRAGQSGSAWEQFTPEVKRALVAERILMDLFTFGLDEATKRHVRGIFEAHDALEEGSK